jgi:ABC-type transport system involved in multi-copper enzyme maturation permease subunit
MSAQITNIISGFISPAWLTGPIFTKELRATSRRRRYYYLRFLYLAVLTICVVGVWLDATGSTIISSTTMPTPGRLFGRGINFTAQMAKAGQTIILFVIWFQFFAAQIIAIVLLSTAISDEIYKRTLGVLITTPITSFQIVMGKLSSRLLQLMLFSAITLPLLAIVRVFGGVSWDFLLSSLCITITTVIFVASLSLLFSIFSKRAYLVIIATVITLGFIFFLLAIPVFSIHPLYWLSRSNLLYSIIFYSNPYAVLAVNSELMMDPSMAARFTLNWPIHCAAILTASAFLIITSTILVRKVALYQVSSLTNPFIAWWRSRSNLNSDKKNKKPDLQPIRYVTGPPIVWKELICPLSRRYKLVAASIILFELAMIFAVYLFPAVTSMIGYSDTHCMYVIVFMSLAIIFSVVLPATTITSEKESRSWLILLTTSLSDWHIILGKFVGSLRRSLPLWLLLFVYIVLFSIAELLHSVAIVHIAIILIGVTILLCASGIYFSSRFKHTTSAVIANFAFAAVIWLVIPLLAIALTNFFRFNNSFADHVAYANPFTQANVVIKAAAKSWRSWPDYRWHGFGSRLERLTAAQTTELMLRYMFAYILMAAIFALRAKKNIRRVTF